MKFDHQNVCITGASRGIGLAIAEAFAREGATVILLARDQERLKREAARITAAGGKTWWHPLDVTREDSVKKAAAAILKRFERVDVLVNNAGVACQGLFWDVEMRSMQQEFEVNCIGMMRVTQAFLPAMIRDRRGVILNISSMLGMAPFPTSASYSATKAAVLAFTQALRGETAAYGIHVGAFMPGHTKTDMGGRLSMKGGPPPVSAQIVAQAVLKAVAAKKKLATIPGPAAILGLHMMRHLPGAAEQLMTGIARKSWPPETPTGTV
ncbi:MAG: SDR family oxidoreductase [Anaerolineales bacterium]|nr:SDR family oxidoreductase [Anaerolineales bacterium]